MERRALLAARALVDRMRTLYRHLERRTGAAIAVHRALACIDGQPGVTASGLAALLGMQRPALSQVLRSLVDRGWAERVRDDSDQRSIRIYLTPAGRQLVGATSGRARGALQRAVRQLSWRGLESLAEGLEALLPHLPEPMEDVGRDLRKARARAVALPGARPRARVTALRARRSKTVAPS